MENPHHYRTAIVLQGGGALGAYEYGVLKALYETRPHFTPAVVTGISIGAINAAVLVGAKEDPIGTLDDVWRHRLTSLQSLPTPVKALSEYLIPPEVQKYLSVWGNSGMYQLRPEFLCAPLLATSTYTLAPLRQTLGDVVNRAAQLSFTSKLTLDQQLFAKFNDFVDLVQTIDRVLQALSTPEAQQIREHPGYTELVRHQKIDAFTVITFRADARLALPGDFSKASIEARIEAGYRDAIQQQIGEPTPTPVAVARIRSRKPEA